MHRFFCSAAVIAIHAGLASTAFAQEETAEATESQGEAANDVTSRQGGARVFMPADFAQFSPRNALEMLERVPGFTLRAEESQRGIGQASANVLINGERTTGKSEGVTSQLQRIATDRVERIEIVEGATFGIAGLSGQVANVITKPSEISGRFTYRANFRPRYAEPSFIGGEVSLSGSGDDLEWTVAASNGVGRGAAGGDNAFIYNADGEIIEQRDVRMRFVGDFPRLSGNVRWSSPGGTIFSANASYRRGYQDFHNDQRRDLVVGVDRFRDFHARTRGWDYELGADVDFALFGGRMKLIGLERYDRRRTVADSTLIFDDGRPDEGSRFDSRIETGERIARSEFSWDMLGGSWQWDAEAAFNRLNRMAQLFDLAPSGEYIDVPFPNATGGVTEDRYETILTHSRSLADNLTMQLGAGGEYSTIAQTGENGLTRSFWRPKGSFNLAWQVEDGLDISFEIARRVGQLSFIDFLASVSLDQDQQNAGNVELVPEQSWDAHIEMRKNLGDWGSTTLRLFMRQIEDYIEFIPVDGGLETRGNIDSASVLGVRWNSTINLDPIGFNGARLDLLISAQETELEDPLTGRSRAFGGFEDRRYQIDFRHDIPNSDWAWGAGFQYFRLTQNIRLFETNFNHEGPIYTSAFVENKDVLGMTARLSVFNLTNGRARQDRLVYAGYRDRSPLLFRETENLSVQPIIGFTLSGDF